MSIKSPYNFVPAPTEGEVYKPYWADQVSHDIPFSDGESGEIELKITAMTPLFIRNGHKKDDKTNDFSHYIDDNGEKKYFIPSSSLKGMFRNVLEIMSFSRMKQVDSDKIFALRDMNNRQFSNTEMRNTKTGWLTRLDDRWVIDECSADRVRTDSVATFFSISNFDELTAVQKYTECNITDFSQQFNFLFDCRIPKTGNIYNLTNESADKTGHLVMFGPMKGKKYEYIFQNPNNAKRHELANQNLYNKIMDIENKNDQSLWNYFARLTSLPVFFKLDNNNTVIHFGFSKLYKLNNTHYLRDLEPLNSYNNATNFEPDLSDIIFGYQKISNQFKGRVSVGHAFIAKEPNHYDIQRRVLGSPKQSFYPAYLKQPDNIDQVSVTYNTYLNSDSVLNGFKKYPIHETVEDGNGSDNENIYSEFHPLEANTEFRCKIRYHNLRKVELGALISAITFHNCPNAFHNIGSAKPYGFGKIKVEIENPSFGLNEALAYFEHEMNLHTKSKLDIKSEWLKTRNIIELLSLTQTAKTDVAESLVYPKLEDTNEQDSKRQNQFNNVKKDNLSLQDFSELNGIPLVKSFLNDEILEKIKEDRKSFLLIMESVKLRKQQEVQQMLAQQKALLEAKNIQFNSLISQANTLYQNNDYKPALSLIEQAEALNLDNVSHHEFKQDVVKAIEIQLKREEIEALKRQEAEKRKAETEAKLSTGLAAYLDEKNINNEYVVRDFKMIKAKLEKYLKDSNQQKLSEQEWDILEHCIERVYHALKQHDQKVWNRFEENKIWIDVTNFTSEDFAKKLFSKLVRKE